MNTIFGTPIKSPVYFRNTEFTPQEIESAVKTFEAQLCRTDRGKSPFAYLFAQNHVKTVIATIGLIRAKKIVVLVDPNIGKLELEEMMDDTPPSVIINLDMNTIKFNYSRELKFLPLANHVELKDDLTDVCIMKYTAGFDGKSKAAMLTFNSINDNAQSIADCSSAFKDSVTCSLLPMYHLYGLQTNVLGQMVYGGKIHIVDISDLRRLKTIADEIHVGGVTHLYATPLAYHLFAIDPGITDQFEGISSFTSGGIKLAESTWNLFQRKFGKIIQEGYGLTEGGPVCTWHKKGDEIKINTVGKAGYFCKIKAFDSHGDMLDNSHKGELCILGDSIMKGYYGDRKKTEQKFYGKWLRSGDFGFINNRSYVIINGQMHNHLNVAGKNVYPKELQRHLLKSNMLKVCSIGSKYSQLKGDVIKAEVELIDNTETNRKAFEDWVKRNLSTFRIPKSYKYAS